MALDGVYGDSRIQMRGVGIGGGGSRIGRLTGGPDSDLRKQNGGCVRRV